MKTYNVKITFENKEDETYWSSLLDTSMKCYNDVASISFKEKIKLSLSEVHKVVYNRMREKYPLIPSQAVIKIYKDVISNYRTSKRKSIIQRKNPVLRLDKRLYSNLTPTSIKLTSFRRNKRSEAKFVLYDKFVELSKQHVMSDPLIFMKGNDFYLSITFKTEEKPVLGDECLGVDLGIKRIVTTSDGFIIKGTKVNGIKRKLRYLKRSLQSKGTKSAKRHLKKLAKKECNINKNYAHYVCNEILKTDKDIIVLEDLKGIKSKTSKTKEGYKRKRHNNMIAQVPFFMIRTILSYKAPLLGKKVVTVSPSYTSQMDCRTSKCSGKRMGCRYYCDDGIMFDADWNAAINIRNRYKHSTPSVLPLDGKMNLVDRVQSIIQSKLTSC